MTQPSQKTRRQPLRRCVGCGEMKDKAAMIRISLNKAGEFEIDPPPRNPGRAAYLCDDPACFPKAQKLKGLERSFKRSVPPEIYMQLAERFLQ